MQNSTIRVVDTTTKNSASSSSWMNRTLGLAVLFALLFGFQTTSQAQCSCDGAFFGSADVSGWTVGQSATIFGMWAGERATLNNTVAGAVYRVSSCGASYDSQLTIFDSACGNLAYNDDNGPACTGTRASVDFTATGSEAWAKLSQYFCSTNSTSTDITVELISLPSGGGGGDCLNNTAFGIATADNSGSLVTISGCSYEEEYSTIDGILAGESYEFALSSGGYITVREGSFDGPVVGQGFSPVTVVANSAANLFPHWNVNDNCDQAASCVTTTVQNVTPAPEPCLNTTSFGFASVDNSGALVTISTCSYEEEYSTVSDAVAGEEYEFTLSSGGYITVREGTFDGPVIAEGFSPVSVVAASSATLYPHWTVNDNCDQAASCVTTTVQCISCAPACVDNEISIELIDSFGDGWNGAEYLIFDDSNALVASGTMLSGSTQEDFYCLADGCYTLEITSGTYPGEITWNLLGVDGGTLSGEAPASIDFSLNTVCAVPGCTNSAALNYNVDATEDDGSCLVPDCADSPISGGFCYGNNADIALVYLPNTAGENIILEFIAGGVENNSWDNLIIYDGVDNSAPVLYANGTTNEDLTGLYVASTLGNGLFISLTSDGSVSCESLSFDSIAYNVYCGFEAVVGCFDDQACNYDPSADIDDPSSCVYACNDTPALAFALSMDALGSCNGLSGQDINEASTAAAEGQGFSAGDGRDLWYSFVPETAGARIEVLTGDFDVMLELQDASNNLITVEDAVFVNGSEILNIGNLTPGEVHYIRVYSWLTTSAPALFDICVQSIPDTRCDYGPGPYSLCNTFKAKWVTGASDYIFNFTSQTSGETFVYQQGFANTFVQLFNVDGLAYDDNYDVEISLVWNLDNGAGDMLDVAVETSQPCEIFVNQQPLAELRDSDNQANYGPHFLGNYVAATPWICSTVDWTWEFVNTDGSELPIVHQRGASNRFMRLSDVPGLQPGAVYEVRVKPEFANGSVTNYGAVQLLSIIGSAGMQTEIDSPVVMEETAERTIEEAATELAIYPNPSNGSYVNLNITNIKEGVETVQFDVYDLFGKRVVASQYTVNGNNLVNQVIALDQLASGVYLVNIIVDGEVHTERLIIQK